MKKLETSLQVSLIDRIKSLIRDEDMQLGDRINEKVLAQRLNVSRSPVRAALNNLADQGYVVRQPQKGVQLIALPPIDDVQDTQLKEPNDLVVRIAHDRDRGLLPDEVSESELMQQYSVSRSSVRATLMSLAELGMVQRKPGYGWRFVTSWNAEVRLESYRFRIVVEPAAILEPTFRLPPGWADEMRKRHEDILTSPWTPTSGVVLYEINAAFHEGIAAASGNRFFLEAIRRQNRLRRFSNYSWSHGMERVRISHIEHMEILTRLEERDFEVAAALMRRHLVLASQMVPSFEK
jgi:DNA-binding GntR family transcriptional regulator